MNQLFDNDGKKAISLEICMLFRNNNSGSLISVCPPTPESTVVGSVCFSVKKSNHKIRSLFLDLVTSISSSISYWNNLFDDIKWAYVWSLPQKFFLTNKVKEISYKIIHRFYPVKQFLQKFKSDIDISCSFCEFSSETVSSFVLGVSFCSVFLE